MANQYATNYVVFAVGGTGAKVAESMVNLISLGIPVVVDPPETGVAALNAADSFTIVRIDPDKACRSAALQEAINRYQEIRKTGGSGASRGLWSLKLNDLITIHPMDALSGPGNVETLEAKLASKEAGRDTALKILRLFYTDPDITTSFDRGFFQKPFIGAAVIAAMGELKLEAESPVLHLLQGFRGQKVRAFVVGSMYGGTGAAGIPVLSKIIRQYARANNEQDSWQVAGCLLGPYFYPPEPPLRDIEWGNEWRPDGPELLDAFLERTQRHERAFLEEVTSRSQGRGLAGPGQDFSYEEIRQIARGFYAKPDEIERRAVASWDYYQNHGADLFDELLLLGLRNPTRYGEVTLESADYPDDPGFSSRIRWSNGGRNQVSPLHAVEYAAAALGFHFFAKGVTEDKGTMLLGVHQHDGTFGDALCWADLAFHPSVRGDKRLYACLAGYNWLAFSLIRFIETQQSFENARNTLQALHHFVDADHYESFHRDLNVLVKNIGEALQHTARALGWEEENTAPLMRTWLRQAISYGKTGGLLRREAMSHSFAGWRMDDVDTEAIGKDVPKERSLDDLRGDVSTEAKGALPLGVSYLQSLWNYLAGSMTEIKEGLGSAGTNRSRGFLLPRFGYDHWSRIGVPTKAGEIKMVASSDTFIRDGRLFNVLDPRFRIIAREAKPSMWAHAETFYETLAASVANRDVDAEEFQIWAGILAAVFQGDLEAARFERDALLALDEDLYPALKASLPFSPDPVQWPDVLYDLHKDSALTVIRTGEGGAVVGACYSPCLVFPALQAPLIAQDHRLGKFQAGTSERPDLRLAVLMERYNGQPGFSQAFEWVLGKLSDQIRERERSSLFLNLQKALSLLRTFLGERFAAKSHVPGHAVKPDETSFLGFVYENVFEQKFKDAGAGNVGYWEVYPLRSMTRTKPVLIIPEGVDPAANPWVLSLAFPESPDVHTRLCDLSIHTNSEKGTTEVRGKDGKIYEVSNDFHLLSLHPQAPPHLRVILDALFYLEGADNALDPALLEDVHNDWRRNMTTREDITPLIPLHTNLLRLFPEYIVKPRDLVSFSGGSVGDSNAAEAVCRLTLPLPPEQRFDSFRALTWRTRLIGWKLDDTRLPMADVWPAFRGKQAPLWSSYFIRTQLSPGKLALFFHGDTEIRPRPAAAGAGQEDQPYSVDRLSSPPRVAEVFSSGKPGQGPLGLIFINAKVYREIPRIAERWQVAVDFGTSNTSVALQEGDTGHPSTLEIKPWAAPLLYPISARLAPPLPYPGWFLQGPRAQSFHRGFFPTLLGYRKALALDQDLLKTLANPASQRSEDFGALIGSLDLLGVKGRLALEINRTKGLSNWGVEDNLKWASAGENADSELRRKAFRTVFLELLLLHVAAEAYAQTGSLPARYTFTYPLSMKRSEVSLYRASAKRAVEVVEGLVSPLSVSPNGPDTNIVNESQAAFRAYTRSRNANDNLTPNKRVVLIDMGGGSADYAVFAGASVDDFTSGSPTTQLCFLDSVVLAGNRFFEFIQDVGDPAEYETLEKSLKAFFTDLDLPKLSSLRDEGPVRLLRQFYTLSVGSMMPDKSPFFHQHGDIESLEHKEVAVTEMLSQKLDHYSPGHWMRSLFSVVLTHGLLLAIAPLPRQKTPSSIDLVLAGNGWGLLPHAGVLRSSNRITALVREAYRRLKRTVEFFGKLDGPNVLPDEMRINVRFMDDVVAEVLQGKGVYSKDIVAAGGILEGRGDDHITAQGIIGFDLPVLPVMGQRRVGQESSAGEPIVLPWYSSAVKETVDSLIRQKLEERSGQGERNDPFSQQKVTRLRPAPSILQPKNGPQSVPEQLLALDMLKTGGFGGPAHEMLDTDQWEEWNAALFENIGRALDVYGEASSDQQPETTSLVRNIWEYSLLHRQVRRGLFRLMNGGT